LYSADILRYCLHRFVTFPFPSRLPPAWFASRLPSAAKSRIVLDQVAACVPDDDNRSSAQHTCW